MQVQEGWRASEGVGSQARYEGRRREMVVFIVLPQRIGGRVGAGLNFRCRCRALVLKLSTKTDTSPEGQWQQ